MNISKNNYETFFLDYYEKNLSPQQVAELLLFLEENLDLKKEFESFQNISVAGNEKIVFDKKGLLKKNIVTKENFDEFAVANIEGDLNSEEKKSFEKFIAANPSYKKQSALFAKTKLTASKIIFPDKKSLKRGAKIISINPFYYAAAACIILMLAFYFGNQRDKQAPIQTAQKVIAPVQKQENISGSTASYKKKQEAGGRKQEKKIKKIENINPVFAEAEKRIAVPPLISYKDQLVEWPYESLPLKSLQLFPIYLLDEYYASAEPIPASVFDKWKKEAMKNLAPAADENDWFADENFSAKKKTKLIDVLAAALNKVTGKKVNLKPNYNDSGEMMSYDFSLGKINLKKDFSK